MKVRYTPTRPWGLFVKTIYDSRLNVFSIYNNNTHTHTHTSLYKYTSAALRFCVCVHRINWPTANNYIDLISLSENIMGGTRNDHKLCYPCACAIITFLRDYYIIFARGLTIKNLANLTYLGSIRTGYKDIIRF